MIKHELKCTVSIRTEQKHHGSRGTRMRSANPAAAAKLSSILFGGQLPTVAPESEEDNSDKQAPKTKKNRTPKEYGSHSGNTHTHMLYEAIVKPGDNVGQIHNRVANMIAYFESRPSWDLKTKRHMYSQAKSDVLAQTLAVYGNEISDQVTTKVENRLAKYSFDYTKHQLIITLESSEEFPGAKQNSEGVWRLVLCSKARYDEGHVLLSKEVLKALVNSVDTGRKKVPFYANGAKIVQKPDGTYTWVVDFGFKDLGKFEDTYT